jgi:hypothetical protein
MMLKNLQKLAGLRVGRLLLLSAMSLTACGTTSELPATGPRSTPPAKPIVREPIPQEDYLKRALENIRKWREQLEVM